MSDRQQSVIEHLCISATLEAIALGEAIQAPVMKANVESGVINKYWSPEMLTTFKDKWDEVVSEQSASDPAFKKIHDDLAKFRNNYDLWESNAFLPRPKPSL
jgi:TRAP-type mannitol/chloroaromatic compound transport system substrate-binding protein